MVTAIYLAINEIVSQLTVQENWKQWFRKQSTLKKKIP